MIVRSFSRAIVSSLVVLFFVVFPSRQVHAQHRYDTLFTLQGYPRAVLLQRFLHELLHKPEEFKKLNALIQAKGSATDKCQVNLTGELMAVAGTQGQYEKEITITEKYLVQAKKLNNHFLQAYCYHNISENYSWGGFNNKSFENKLYCLDELEKDPAGNYFEQSWILHQVASEYYRFRDYAKTIELCKTAFDLNGINSPNASWFIKVVSNLAGMSYLKNGMYDSAMVWLQKTYAIAVQHRDTAWQGIATGNFGSIYYMQKKYPEAISFYEKALPFCRKEQLWSNIAPFCCLLADCYLQSGNTSAIPDLLAEAKYANTKAYNLWTSIKYYTVAGDYYRKTGNIAMALQCTDSLMLYQNKQTEEFDVNKKIQAEAQLAYRSKELENEIAGEKIKRNKWMLFGLGILLVLLCVIGVLFYKRQRLRYTLMQEQLEHEKYKAQEQLQLAMIKIHDFTNKVQEKNEMIQQFTKEIALLKEQNKSITDDQLKQIEQLKQSAVLTDDDWNNFKQLFERVHPGYLRNLKTKYPGLTPAETRYLIFTRLELNSRKMSAMLGVSAEAIRNIRFRVKKKLGLEDNDEIERIVNEL